MRTERIVEWLVIGIVTAGIAVAVAQHTTGPLKSGLTALSNATSLIPHD